MYIYRSLPETHSLDVLAEATEPEDPAAVMSPLSSSSEDLVSSSMLTLECYVVKRLQPPCLVIVAID